MSTIMTRFRRLVIGLLSIQLFAYNNCYTTTTRTTTNLVVTALQQPQTKTTPTKIQSWTKRFKVEYKCRVAADPSFTAKSIAEVIIAAGTQFTAEWNRRGASRLLPEIDFVFPAIVTAVLGKYYSMWRVAKTKIADDDDDNSTTTAVSNDKKEEKERDLLLFGKIPVPTNAFQRTMIDAKTYPTIVQRFGSFIAPMWPLARTGFVVSAVGYGFTTIVIELRTLLLPSYIPVTKAINVWYASIYTGCFMALVSNIRYQILQGIIEPFIDYWFTKYPILRSILIFIIRWANGLLGSILAITGMRYFGLQKLK